MINNTQLMNYTIFLQENIILFGRTYFVWFRWWSQLTLFEIFSHLLISIFIQIRIYQTMTSKRKYKNKQKVECMSCGEVLLKENEGMHVKRKHVGGSVKFKFHNDAKQLRLPFQVDLSKDLNSNLTQDSVNLEPTVVNEGEASQSVEYTTKLDDGLADQDIDSSTLGDVFDSNPQDIINSSVAVQSSLDLSEGSGDIHEYPQEMEEFAQGEADVVSNLRCVSEDLPFKPKLEKFNPKSMVIGLGTFRQAGMVNIHG